MYSKLSVLLFIAAVGCDLASMPEKSKESTESDSQTDTEVEGGATDSGIEADDGTTGNSGDGPNGDSKEQIRGTYEVATGGGPSGRSRARALKLNDDRVLIYGGSISITEAPSAVMNDGFLFEATSKSWKPISQVNSPKFNSMAKLLTATAKGIAYFWGNAGSPEKSMFVTYDSHADAWKEIVNPLSVAELPNFILASDSFIFTDRGKRFNITSASFEDMANRPWNLFLEDYSKILCAGKIFVWGGYIALGDSTATAGIQNKGWLYNVDSNTWVPTTIDGAPSGRMFHAASCAENKIVIWGGQTNKRVTSSPPAVLLDDGGIYDPVTDSWEPISSQSEVMPRTRSNIFVRKNKLILANGRCTLDPVKNCDTFDIFDLINKTWQVLKIEDQELLSHLKFSNQAVEEISGHLFLYGGDYIGENPPIIYSQKAFLYPVLP